MTLTKSSAHLSDTTVVSVLICASEQTSPQDRTDVQARYAPTTKQIKSSFFVGSSSQADYLMRNAAMDDSIGGS